MAEQLRLIGKRMGPAPMPPGVAKDRVVSLRLNAGQLKRLEALAAIEELSVAETMRAALLIMELAVKNPGTAASVLLDDALRVERVVEG